MGTFLSCFLQLLLLTCLPPFVFGLAAWGLQWFYRMLVGDRQGRPLLVAVSALSTPLREMGHVLACMLSFHRIEEMRLLDLQAPDGEWGFVEHSYHPRNPIAIFGNFLYALGPVFTGLVAVLIIFFTCFYGVLPPFFEEIRALGEAGAGFGAYVKAALSLIPAMFTAGEAPMVLRIIGCVLLLAVCCGIHISPAEVSDAVGGALIYALLLVPISGILMLFDARVLRMTYDGLRGYATGVTALYAVVLLALAALVVLGFVFGVIRTLFTRSDDPDGEV